MLLADAEIVEAQKGGAAGSSLSQTEPTYKPRLRYVEHIRP